MDENPDDLPDLVSAFPVLSAKIWQNNPSGTTPPLVTLENMTPITTVQDILGYYARRMATFDFSHQSAIASALNGQNPTVWRRQHVTELARVPDKPGWWRVPNEIAPMQSGYAIHRLIPTGSGDGRVVTVDFQGLHHAARQTGWRASFVAVSDGGQERYTLLWSQGVGTITLAADENQLYLAVAAAPDAIPYAGHNDLTWPYRSDPGKQRMHYEIAVGGATPNESANGSTAGLVQHANGGGWKSTGAQVDDTAYIGPNARVLGTAQVRNNARIEDYAVVQNSADIFDNAVISGHALIMNDAEVRGNAKIRDWAIVSGNSTLIQGNAIVAQHARAQGLIDNDAIVKGVAILQGGTDLSGDAVIDGDYMAGRIHTTGFAFGHLPYTGVPDTWIRPAPDRITASYSFDAPRDTVTLDDYGALEAFVRGAPGWIAGDATHVGFYALNGVDQWISLERLVADTSTWTFTAWVKPLGGAADQALLWIGDGANKHLSITPDDGGGRARFSIGDGAATQELVAPEPLLLNVWSHVALTLDGAIGTLYINGSTVASGAVTIPPDRLLPPNTGAAEAHCYLGRSQGSSMAPLRGAIDDVRFYRRALGGSEIGAMIPPPAPPAVPLETAGTLYVDLRAADSSAGASTWLNNGTLGDFVRIGTPRLVADVGGTGRAGVEFKGTSDAYNGPNSVPDLDGASDRSIEVWAYNPSLAVEETMVSWGHRGSDRREIAFNFGSHAQYGAVTHYADDVGWGTNPTPNAWHYLVYTYTGGVARVYVDGAPANNKTLALALNTFANEPINLGCQRDRSNGTRSFFYSGYLNAVRVHGGVLTNQQIADNHIAGPPGHEPSASPTISDVEDLSVPGGTVAGPIEFTIDDPDTPLEALTVAVTSSNPTLLPNANVALGGAGAGRTVALTPTTNLGGRATITLSVSDGETLTSDTFDVTFESVNRNRSWERYR
jgi:carbonic anhydrase/acetyltransferase-like protein (isoleucine patch superfamily)